MERFEAWARPRSLDLLVRYLSVYFRVPRACKGYLEVKVLGPGRLGAARACVYILRLDNVL